MLRKHDINLHLFGECWEDDDRECRAELPFFITDQQVIIILYKPQGVDIIIQE